MPAAKAAAGKIIYFKKLAGFIWILYIAHSIFYLLTVDIHFYYFLQCIRRISIFRFARLQFVGRHCYIAWECGYFEYVGLLVKLISRVKFMATFWACHRRPHPR